MCITHRGWGGEGGKRGTTEPDFGLAGGAFCHVRLIHPAVESLCARPDLAVSGGSRDANYSTKKRFVDSASATSPCTMGFWRTAHVTPTFNRAVSGAVPILQAVMARSPVNKILQRLAWENNGSS